MTRARGLFAPKCSVCEYSFLLPQRNGSFISASKFPSSLGQVPLFKFRQCEEQSKPYFKPLTFAWQRCVLQCEYFDFVRLYFHCVFVQFDWLVIKFNKLILKKRIFH